MNKFVFCLIFCFIKKRLKNYEYLKICNKLAFIFRFSLLNDNIFLCISVSVLKSVFTDVQPELFSEIVLKYI